MSSLGFNIYRPGAFRVVLWKTFGKLKSFMSLGCVLGLTGEPAQGHDRCHGPFENSRASRIICGLAIAT